MVANRNGSPLWRQKTVHSAIKKLREHGQFTDAPTRPAAAMCSHIVIQSQLSTVPKDSCDFLVRAIARGLIKEVSRTSTTESQPTPASQQDAGLVDLLTAASIKLLAAGPSKVKSYAPTFCLCYLRLCTMEVLVGTGPVLLSLQGLTIALGYVTSESGFSDLRNAVVGMTLSLLNHPFGLIRQATLQVRNKWSVAAAVGR